MTLVEIREAFVRRTGRYDLVVDTTDWADNGADFYIQAGSRMLDRLEEHEKSKAKTFVTLAVGDWYAVFQECRAILDVWIAGDEYRKKLQLRDIDTMRAYYNDLPTNIDNEVPEYYSPALLRTYPLGTKITVDEWQDTTFEIADKADYEYNGVIFMPPADDAYVLEVQGYFYAKKLTDDAHVNYWSAAHPEILVMGASYILELMYRNTEGAKDWMTGIKQLLSDLGKDFVEEQASGVNQIRG